MKLITELKDRYKAATGDKDFGEIFSGSILVFGAQILVTVLGLLISVLVARKYGDAVLGVLVLVNSFFQVVTLFTLFGSSTSILRLIPEYKSKFSWGAAYGVYKKTSLIILVFSIVIGILIFFSAGIISDNVFSQPNLKLIFRIAATIVIFKSFQSYTLPVLRAINAITSYALIQVTTQLLFLLLIIIVPYFYTLDYLPIYLQYLTIVIITIFGLIIIQRNFERNGKNQGISFKEILAISFPMFLTSSMMVLMGQIPTLIIGIFKSEEDVAYYSVAFRIAALTLFVLQAINTVVAPKFAELYSENKLNQLFYVARKSTKLIFYSVTPIFLLFILFGRWVIVGLYGDSFDISYTLLVILCIGMLVSGLSGSVGYFLNMTGNEKIVRNVALMTLILGVVLTVLLIKIMGLIGVAIATTVMLSMRNIVLTIVVQRKFGKNFSIISVFSKE